MAVTSNTGTVAPTKVTETTIVTLAGGPFDLLSVFAQGGQTPDAVGRVAYRLYAVVGGLQSLIAESVVVGNATASILQWQAPGSGASASQFVEAGGDSYVLTVQQVPGSSVQVAAAATATIAGVDKLASTTDTNVASTVNVLPYSETSTGAVSGYAQFMDVGVNQAGLPRTTSVIVYASCGGGSVEAIVKQDALGGPDGTTAVIRRLALPVATSYRVGVRNQDARAVSVPTSIATYSEQVTNVSPSALTPGPQLTVLRSTPATVPTQVVWASTGYVDFVADCGADPTGVADCAPALDRAAVLLLALAADPRLPESSLTLFIPPGVYALRSAPLTPIWNFSNLGTSLTIQGCGHASVIEFYGFSGPTIANAFQTYLRDVTCVGTNVNVPFTLDCAECFQLNTTEVGAVERCKFYNLFVSASCLQLSGGLWAVRDCSFSENACSAEALAFGAVLWAPAAQGLDVENCYFEDISRLNGYAPGYNKAAANRLWLRFDGLGAGSVEQNTIVKIKNCLFDEACTYAVFVKKQAAGARIHLVRIEGCYFNPPIHYNGSFAGPTACVHVEGVDLVEIHGMIDSGFTTTAPGPALDIVDVKSTRVSGLLVNNAAQSNYITADAACLLLRVEDSPTLLPANIYDGTAARSLAKTNQLEDFGTSTEVECFVGRSTGAIAVGGVVKLAPTGFTPIAPTDGVGLAAGVSLDVVGGVASIRVAKRGQVVTALSDGTTVIAIGDPITNLGAAVAGQVKKSASTGTTPIIGTAATGAAAGGGAVLFDMLFETGEA